MFYLIQENTFNEKGHDRLIQALKRLNLPYEIIKVKPFIEELEFQTTRKDVFCFGGLKMARLSSKYGWRPGSLMTRNHNFLIYRNHYRDNLLNFDSQICRFDENFGWAHRSYFIRPCEDTKSFSGQEFDMISWESFKHRVRDGSYHSQLKPETLIQVAHPKRLQKEYRLWIVNGKVITGSQYKLGTRTVYSDTIDPGAIDFCQKMVSAFQLSSAFVMDVCLYRDKWKIVECGCINCAGFYEADMQRLIIALEDSACSLHAESQRK